MELDLTKTQAAATHTGRTAIAILALSLLQTHANAASAGLAQIGRAFPGLSQTTVSLVLTTVAISIVPAMLIAGALAARIGEKRLVLAGFGMAMTFGLLSFFIQDFGLLLAARALTGFGAGLISPFQASLIPRHFEGYAAHRLFGLQSAAVSLLGIFFGLAGGVLSALRWNYGFLVYLIAIPGIVLIARWLPDDRVRDTTGDAPRKPFRFTPMLGYLTGMHFLFSLLQFQFVAGIAYLLVDTGTGDAGTAGTCVAIFSLGAFLSSMTYGKIQHKFGFSAVPVALAIGAAGLLLIGAGSGLPLYFAGSFATGSSLGIVMPSVGNRVTTAYRDSNPSLAIAIPMGAFFSSQLLSPFILRQAVVLPGGDTEAGRFIYAGIGMLLLALVVMSTWKKGLST